MLLKQISPNHGTLPNGALRPEILNSPFASRFLINLDLLLPHVTQFDNIIVLPLLVFATLGFMFLYIFYILFYFTNVDSLLYLRF